MCIQEFLESPQRLMPLLSFRLTSSLVGIQANQPLACDIKKWIKGQSSFIAESRVLGSLQPGLHVAFSYPSPWILTVQLHGLVEIGPSFVDMIRETARRTVLGIRNGNQAQ